MDHSAPAPTVSPSAVRARWATAAVFFLNGFTFASWALHVPTVKNKLGLTPAVLGLALLAIAVGSLLTMPPTGRWVARWGSRPVTRAFAVVNPLTLLPLLLAPSLIWQVLALALYGAVSGGLDVAMNAQGLAVERRLGRPVLSSFHAAWSLGGLLGAALGSLALAWGAGATAHVTVVAAVFFALALLAGPALLPREDDLNEVEGAQPTARRRLSPTILLLGALGFLGLLAEGAVSDWSALYYRSVLGSGPGASGLGYVAFTFAMTAGRLSGDWARARFGGAAVLRGGAALCALGLAGALLIASPLPSALGFAAAGLGLANLVPVIFDAAGQTGNAGTSIAQVSTLAYLGFLVGPPLVGFVAQLASLPAGLGLVAALAGVIALLGGRAARGR